MTLNHLNGIACSLRISLEKQSRDIGVVVAKIFENTEPRIQNTLINTNEQWFSTTAKL
jgi:hypothetical protein